LVPVGTTTGIEVGAPAPVGAAVPDEPCVTSELDSDVAAAFVDVAAPVVPADGLLPEDVHAVTLATTSAMATTT
jgi:hypothetical protein